MHELYMQRCLELAQNAIGNTAPNPMVGSVIVLDNQIIGEGYHQRCGEAHAEVNAINSVKNEDLFLLSTLYVNLEPCSHFGRTPPCSDYIIRHKIPRVVIGCVDSFAKVCGNGIRKLKEAGCEVITGVLEKESIELNRRFFTFHEKKRPYIILKFAQTIDGFIDILRNPDAPHQPTWINNPLALRLVHKWRTEEDAILVGTNTAFTDNPKLNVRTWSGKNPLRVVIDKNLRLPDSLYLFDHSQPTIVFTARKAVSKPNLEFVTIDFSKNIIPQILEVLYEKEVQSLIVEGGTQVLNSFIELGLWDEARIFEGNQFFGKGVKAPIFEKIPIKSADLNGDRLFYYRNLE